MAAVEKTWEAPTATIHSNGNGCGSTNGGGGSSGGNGGDSGGDGDGVREMEWQQIKKWMRGKAILMYSAKEEILLTLDIEREHLQDGSG